jgi:SAM-dependent methyltransferase
MHLATKARNVLRGVVQAYGSQRLKKRLWDREFGEGRWDCLDATADDCVYPYLAKYANGGRILDLGCGSGSTSNELAATAYGAYTGVDISEVALEKARRRSHANGRAGKNQYFQSDIITYVPSQPFNVILFRDSIYYVPSGKITDVLNGYAKYLEMNGVFIVRLASGTSKYKPVVDGIERSFDVVEKHVSMDPDAVVLVFRPLSN